MRYNSPARGRVFPDEFIPVLEQSGLILEVGLWVLREAATQCKKWREFLPELRVSVNFSVLQFEDIHLAEKVVKILNEVGLPTEALTAEITESIELHSSERLINTMRELKSHNISFAIDDFGTGYSNLGYLKQLNVDEIKIDRIFISGIENDTYNHKLISNVIEFAKGNDIRTCCEGVENARELAVLELLLPDVMQGYLFDKPVTADGIERAYINNSTPEYKNRLDFINKIYELKEKLGILRFDPKDILRENGVGLWAMRIIESKNRYELHIDATMEDILAVETDLSPAQCYEYCVSRIKPECKASFEEALSKTIKSGKTVQTEFLWNHPQRGEVTIRFSGKRVTDSDERIVLEGYCRISTDITGA